MLPVGFCAVGWSSFSISERTRFRRAAFDARTMIVLLRGSATMVVRNDVSVWPWPATATGAAPDSISRATSGAMSDASALRSGMISTSVALEMSRAAMIRPSRCRLSA